MENKNPNFGNEIKQGNNSEVEYAEELKLEEPINENKLIQLIDVRPKKLSIKIAILAIFTALGIALSTVFIYIPYIELMTLTIFLGGVILGPLYGSFLALITVSLYEVIATALIGPGLVIFPFKIVAFLLIVLFGALIGKNMPKKTTLFWRFFIGVIGGLLTILYDLIINIGWILLSNNYQFIGYLTALLIGMPVTASKMATNVILFFFIPDILNRAIIPILNR